ncbi:MAG: S-adenosylmethionine:tRNA ribosyltransferase-isomerase, partial [Candidatus Methylomirabilales bacterium]
MQVADFDYHLPPDLIAQHPAEARDRSRLLILHHRDGNIEDRLFADLPLFLREGDLLVMNDTKVIPARLYGRSEGGAVEILLVRELEKDRWEALLKPSRKARPGRKLIFAPGSFEALIEGRLPKGRVLLRFLYEGKFRGLLDRYGVMPLPPYIVSHQPSAISHQPSVISHQSSVISHQSSVISHQSSVIS